MPESLREANEQLSRIRGLLERRRRKSARSEHDESAADMVKRIQVFAKTQGRVVGSYTKRIKAASGRAKLTAEQSDQMAKVIGLMDQLDAVMKDLEPAARAVKV